MSESSLDKSFTPDFEEKVVQAILGDPIFGEQVLEVLEPDFFDQKHTQELVKILVNYYHKYDVFPSVSLIQDICATEIKNPMLRKECAAYIDRMKKRPLNGDSQYIKDKSLMFFRTQAVKNALLNEVIPRMEKENLEEILPILQGAINKGTSRNIGFEYNEDQELRFIENETNKVPTKWKILNKFYNGGWEAGRLVTFIGGSGAGKSHMLVNVGVGALLAGKTVVHYTLELSEIDVARRYDANLTCVDINNVPKNKNKILSVLKNKLPPDCELIIKEYPMWTASVQTIKSHLSRLRIKDKMPDIIIIDYGDLLSPMKENRKDDRPTSSIWGNMKTLAQEKKVPVITATQCNRDGFNDEVLMPDKVADDFKKIMHSDGIITMARNMEQKASGVGKIYNAKNRQGEDGQILAYSINTYQSTIEMFELTEEVQDKIEKAVKDVKMKNIKNDKDALQKFLKDKKNDND